MNRIGVAYTGFSSYSPECEYTNKDLSKLGIDLDSEDEFFKGVNSRRWASQRETSVFMGSQAVKETLRLANISKTSIDYLICSSLLGDYISPSPACGIQYECGLERAPAICIDSGCSSFISGLINATHLIKSGAYENIIVVAISNFAGKAQSKLRNASSSIPGDGAAACLVSKTDQDNCNYIGSLEKSYGEYHGMFAIKAMENNEPTDFCKPHDQIAFHFEKETTEKIKENGRRIVPDILLECMKQNKIMHSDINYMITHQPNDYLLSYWRQEVGIDKSKHFDTLSSRGNLFQASIPTSIHKLQQRIGSNQRIVLALASFSFAGEFAASLIIRIGSEHGSI